MDGIDPRRAAWVHGSRGGLSALGVCDHLLSFGCTWIAVRGQADLQSLSSMKMGLK
jgi:hypothetical protein